MDQDFIKNEYDGLLPSHKKLETNLKDALAGFLNENNISFHTITSRIKDKESYLDKIERKGYTDHKNQIEDLCGLRIICYYPEDLDNIGEIITKEFQVIESINKSNLLEPDRFGYRSDHYIVVIKEEWTKAPNYRNLKSLKAEIQVRTILMHAWADIEHKLAYKSKEQIPAQFRRQLYQLSALLEIADAQFQNLKVERHELKESLIIEDSYNQKVFDASQELNLDTFQVFLDFYFPDRPKNPNDNSTLFEELKSLQIPLQKLNELTLTFNLLQYNPDKDLGYDSIFLSQAGMIRFILDIYIDEYWESRKDKNIKPDTWLPTIQVTRDKIKTKGF